MLGEQRLVEREGSSLLTVSVWIRSGCHREAKMNAAFNASASLVVHWLSDILSCIDNNTGALSPQCSSVTCNARRLLNGYIRRTQRSSGNLWHSQRKCAASRLHYILQHHARVRLSQGSDVMTIKLSSCFTRLFNVLCSKSCSQPMLQYAV